MTTISDDARRQIELKLRRPVEPMLGRPGGPILVGDSVFYKCRNPATGRVKRMAKDRSWADVEWDDGSRRYTKRVKTKNIELLCAVLNEWMGYT